MFLQNTGWLSPDYMALYPRIQHPLERRLSGPQEPVWMLLRRGNLLFLQRVKPFPSSPAQSLYMYSETSMIQQLCGNTFKSQFIKQANLFIIKKICYPVIVCRHKCDTALNFHSGKNIHFTKK
jgi:hypothetical protein